MREPLYQVSVETRAGRVVPFGPRMPKQFCEQFANAISTQIALGKEKSIFNPHVVAAL